VCVEHATVPVIALVFTRIWERIHGASAAFMRAESREAPGCDSAMFIYEILLATGVLGLIAMAFAGFGFHGGAHHAGHVGMARFGHAPTSGRLGPGAHTGHTAGGHLAHRGGAHPAGKAARGAGQRSGLASALLSLLSPITIFGACLGAGAVGALLVGLGVSWALAALGAVAGAIGVNALLVQPMMRLAMGFASEPARGLEGTLMQSAEAITNFDANGEGLVRVLVDGQSVDVLARLTDEERRQGVRVVRGQSVRIEDVDTHRNRCSVSRM
jgi:hypothetical protein